MFIPTLDNVLYGKLKMWQPDDGPRVNMDTILLAAWVRRRARRNSFVELGSAAGAVSMMLALRFPPPFHITGVEIQSGLVDMAERSMTENGLEGRVSFVRGDLRDASLLPRESFDGLVVNPPYYDEAEGRASHDESRSIARHGVTADGMSCCSLDDIADAAQRLLKIGGRMFAVFRADGMSRFMYVMEERSLVPKRLRMVHERADKPAGLFLTECVRGGGSGLIVEPPLFVRDDCGEYTDELMSMYTTDGKGER